MKKENIANKIILPNKKPSIILPFLRHRTYVRTIGYAANREFGKSFAIIFGIASVYPKYGNYYNTDFKGKTSLNIVKIKKHGFLRNGFSKLPFCLSNSRKRSTPALEMI